MKEHAIDNNTAGSGNPLGTAPVGPLLRKFAIPSIVAMMVGALYNIVDQFFIGQYIGELGNAATNVAFPLSTISTALALFLGVGLLAKKTGFFSFWDTFYICALCSLAMPLGLNTIVIPSAYGKDTTVASGMALVSHLLGCITIPVIFALYQVM